MALPIYDVVSQFTGAGNLAEYTFDFKITSADQLLVVVNDASGNEVQRVRGDDTTYLLSVDFDAIKGGGTVTLQANLPSNYEIYIFFAGDEPCQDSEFNNKRDFTLKRIEAALDKLGSFIQRTFFLAKRSVSLYDTDQLYDPVEDIGFDPTLPKGLAANTDELVPVVQEGGWAPVSSWVRVSDIISSIVTSDGLSTPQIIGSRAAPSNISASIPFNVLDLFWDYRWYIQGNGGPVTITDITAGNNVGQRITFFIPQGVANTVTIPDTAIRFELNGEFVGSAGRVLALEWNGTNWQELWRN